MRMSGGCAIAPWVTAAQFESRFDILLPSFRPASITGMPMLPAWPPLPVPMPGPASLRPAPAVPPVPAGPDAGLWNWQPAITTAAANRNVTRKRIFAVERLMTDLQEREPAGNPTGLPIVRGQRDLLTSGQENVSPTNVSRTRGLRALKTIRLRGSLRAGVEGGGDGAPGGGRIGRLVDRGDDCGGRGARARDRRGGRQR